MRQGTEKSELEHLLELISQRVGRCLERQGWLEQDAQSAWLELEPLDDTDALPQIMGSSLSYRVAVDPQQSQKAFMIRPIRPLGRPDPGLERVAKTDRSFPRALMGQVAKLGSLGPQRPAFSLYKIGENAEVTAKNKLSDGVWKLVLKREAGGKQVCCTVTDDGTIKKM